jgi:putative radical SAM enzyme (TIGR03279 family)
MLGNKQLEPILPRLKWLAEQEIQLHTQAVVCPGMNDGAALRKTIEELARLQPNLATLAVVPVGLTRYREHLPRLRRPDPREAAETIDLIESLQTSYLEACGSRFVWPSDEYYLLAGRPIPPLSHYEDMEQWENGVGMLRQATVDFNRRRRFLKVPSRGPRMAWLTGMAAADWLRRTAVDYLRERGVNIKLLPVMNRFWGDMVTVSGLLTGRDILAVAQRARREFDIAVLPPNCVNHEGLFLDDMSLDEFRGRLKRPVIVGQYSLFDTVREALR